MGLRIQIQHETEKKLILSHSFPLSGEPQFNEKGMTFYVQVDSEIGSITNI